MSPTDPYQLPFLTFDLLVVVGGDSLIELITELSDKDDQTLIIEEVLAIF